MRRQITLSLLWLCAIIFLTPTAVHAQWALVDTAGFSSGHASWTSIALNSSEVPFVAFADDSQGNKATVMTYNGSSWVIVGTAGFSSGVATEITLAIDANDSLYVSYNDGSGATVMKYNGTSWAAIGGTGFTPGGVLGLNFALNHAGTPFISFSDKFSNSYKATVMSYTGGSWSLVGTAAFSPGTATYPSLAFDSQDTAYIMFRDGSNNYNSRLMKYNGTSWTSLSGTVPGRVYDLKLLFDSNDTAYSIYYATDYSKAAAAKFNGTSWSSVGTAGFSASTVGYLKGGIDANGKLYTVYQDIGNSNYTTVMTYNGGSWINVGTAGFSAGNGSYTSIAIAADGTPYVSYRDGGNGNRLTVMKYEVTSTWNGTTWSSGAPDSTSKAVIISTTAPTSFSCKDLVIDSSFALNTGTSDVITIYGNLTNNGNGVTGTGTLTFTKYGTPSISGDTVELEGSVIVETGCTLATGNKLRLVSNVTNTGRIGTSAGTITGNVMAQRYSIGKRCYRLYAHPFNSSIALSQLTDEIDISGTGGATKGFTPTYTNSASAYWFDAASADTSASNVNSGWTAFTHTNGTGANSWDQHEVLLMYLRGAKGEGLSQGTYTPSASIFEAAGVVNQGQQVVSLTKGSSSTFAAVGNPFPSGVQMNTVTLGANVGSNYYAWDASSGADGAYVTNAFSLSYALPAYAGFFTNISASTSITFEESDKIAGGVALHKTTAPANWVELLISDSTTKWDRLLINLDANAMDVEDNQDAKKLYNPNLDFYTLSKDGARLAIDVRPYNDGTAIPLGLTAYNRYNKYVIKTGMFDIPAGTKLVLHDKYLNKTEELKSGAEYWFYVTSDALAQGDKRFEINMVGKPTTGIVKTKEQPAQMQLIPNPAYSQVKVSFDKVEGTAHIKMMSVTGQVVYQTSTSTQTGSVMIPLQNIPAGIYIIELQSNNARFTEKLIKE